MGESSTLWRATDIPPVPARRLTLDELTATMAADMPSADPIKRLLERVRAGDAEASAELFELVYGDLRARARARRSP